MMTAKRRLLRRNKAINADPDAGGGVPAPPKGFQLLKGRDVLYLKGADGAYLYGRAA